MRGCQALFDKYYPIETDASLSHAEKLPHMHDWYAQVNDLWVAQEITSSTVAEAVRDIGPRVCIRPGFTQVLATVQEGSWVLSS